jgi:hypothetical protein
MHWSRRATHECVLPPSYCVSASRVMDPLRDGQTKGPRHVWQQGRGKGACTAQQQVLRSVVGELLFWVPDLVAVHHPNQQIHHVYRFCLLSQSKHRHPRKIDLQQKPLSREQNSLTLSSDLFKSVWLVRIGPIYEPITQFIKIIQIS